LLEEATSAIFWPERYEVNWIKITIAAEMDWQHCPCQCNWTVIHTGFPLKNHGMRHFANSELNKN
jgi:hypothetical protein